MLDNILEAIVLLFAGMSVVLISLSALAGLIKAMKSLDERVNIFRIKQYAEKVKTQQTEEQVNDELVAVLSAAAMAALAKTVHVRRVQFLSSDTDTAWAVTGRLNIMASHHIPKRRT